MYLRAHVPMVIPTSTYISILRLNIGRPEARMVESSILPTMPSTCIPKFQACVNMWIIPEACTSEPSYIGLNLYSHQKEKKKKSISSLESLKPQHLLSSQREKKKRQITTVISAI